MGRNYLKNCNSLNSATEYNCNLVNGESLLFVDLYLFVIA